MKDNFTMKIVTGFAKWIRENRRELFQIFKEDREIIESEFDSFRDFALEVYIESRPEII